MGIEKMFIEPNEQEGRFILSEIMQAGNFGKYDKRIAHTQHSSTAGTFYLRTKHRARFLTRYPSEILWDIPFRLYHWWRRNFVGYDDRIKIVYLTIILVFLADMYKHRSYERHKIFWWRTKRTTK